jgi:hypothetical protein
VAVGGVHEHAELRLGARDQHPLGARDDVDLARAPVARDVDQLARTDPEGGTALVIGTRVRNEHAILRRPASLQADEVERRLDAFGHDVEVAVGSGQTQVDEVTPVGRDVGRHVVAPGLVGRELALGGAVEGPLPDAPLPVPERLPHHEAVTDGGERFVVGLPARGLVRLLGGRELREARRSDAGRLAAEDDEDQHRQRGQGSRAALQAARRPARAGAAHHGRQDRGRGINRA